MEITLKGLSKRFQNEWIFRNITVTLQENHTYALIGPNGSGKSTLMQVIAGLIPPTEGTVHFSCNGRIDPDQAYRFQSIAAPYLELLEEFTLNEFLAFHFNFKKLKAGFSVEQFLEATYLRAAAGKYIKYFSSGMKQRLKLGLAFYADSQVLLLDEPTSNMDEKGVDWYLQEVNVHKKDRIVIICSNQSREYDFCDKKITLTDYK